MNRLLISGIFLLCCFYTRPLHAQGENNIWCFGQGVGLDFNTTPPAFFQHNMKVYEGCATVCDAAGNLLFYSSGSNNWDRNGNLMPNGSGLLGNGPFISGINTGSSMMGVAIVNSPANPQQYYMITTNSWEENLYNAYYSVIDMSLNGGLGDVMPGQKNILLDTGVIEGVVIEKANTCGNYWIILHEKDNPRHLSFKLDPTGINSVPVVSNGILYSAAHMTFNATATLAVAGFTDMQLLSFDKATGIFSPLGQLDAFPFGSSSAVFSPDGTKLYAGLFGLLQYDLGLLPNIAAVQSSRTLIDTATQIHLRKGPDNKIYVLRNAIGSSTAHLGCVSNPNAPGTACQYNPNTFVLPAYYTPATYSELGNIIVVHGPDDTLSRLVLDTIICQLPQVTVPASGLYQGYLWNTGSTAAQETFSEDGTYWVYGKDGCKLHADSFRIRFTRFDIDLGADTALCPDGRLLLDATTYGAGYRWQDGSTNPTFTVTGKGSYSVTATVASCSRSDTVLIAVITPYLDLLESDTLICSGTGLTLHTMTNPEGSYLWSNGSTTPAIVIDSAGTYIVTVSNICGTFSDSVHIKTQYCNCTPYAPNAFSPNSDGKNDLFVIEIHCPAITAYNQTIYNRYGQRVYESKQPDQFWNGTFNGAPCDAGTYFYYLEYKNGEEKIRKKGDLVLIR
jgi:gliding motility-associated-like protein